MSSLFSTYLFSGAAYAESLAFSLLEPVTGSSAGGTDFVVTGEALNPVDWDDTFTGVSLSALTFTDTSLGGGSISTASPNLKLTTGTTAGAVAQVQTVHGWTDTQAEVEVLLPKVVEYPASEVNLFELILSVDSNNYAVLGVYVGITPGSLVVRSGVTVGGSQVFTQSQIMVSGSIKLKVLRWGSSVIFVVNGVVFARSDNFVTTSAKFLLSASNGSAAYGVTTHVSYFKYRPFVVFGDEPVHSTVAVSQKRLRGVVPASRDSKGVEAAYAGVVDVSVVGDGTLAKTGAYTYVFDSGLVLVKDREQGIRMSVIGDTLLQTPDNVVRGLGEDR